MLENNDVSAKEVNDTERKENVSGNDGVQLVRGSFDAHAKQKKQGANKKIYLIAAALVVTLIGAIALIITIAASKMGSVNKVDETNVVADPALDRKVDKDDSFQKFRQKKATELDPKTQLSNLELSKDQALVANAAPPKSPDPVAPSSPPPQPPPDSGLFPQIQRFDSGGYSEGSVGEPDISPTSNGVVAISNSSSDTDSSGMSLANNNRGSLNNLSGTNFSPSKAYVMPNRKYLVAHNTYTRCALYTEIITDQPGLIDCRLTEPLYSADGSVVIAEAGDKLTGEQKVEVRSGQTRVFTTWKELQTTAGVRAQLDSLGAGPMGASGTEAWINNHYAQRFGGAVMLSFFQDATASATNALSRNNNSGLTLNSSESNVQSMAEKALENSINIPPTAYILPGTVMTVIVARDIDFSSVFTTQR